MVWYGQVQMYQKACTQDMALETRDHVFIEIALTIGVELWVFSLLPQW